MLGPLGPIVFSDLQAMNTFKRCRLMIILFFFILCDISHSLAQLPVPTKYHDSYNLRIDEMFGEINNTAAGQPSQLWGSDNLQGPLPTCTFWQNFVIKNGTAPEYIHPFLIQSNQGKVSICYPTQTPQSGVVFQPFVADISVSYQGGGAHHVVSHFDDLSVTLSYSNVMKVPLVRGSPYVTLVFKGGIPVFSTIHAVLDVISDPDYKKHKVVMNSSQTWLIYSSAPLHLGRDLHCHGPYKGVIRISLLVGGNSRAECILDRFNGCYPVAGHVDFNVPFEMTYVWKSKGEGELLMLTLPLHRDVMADYSSRVPELSFTSIDGTLEGIVGRSLTVRQRPIQVGWYSSKGVLDSTARHEIAQALEKDAKELAPIQNNSTYFYGKGIARVARLALIAEEIGCFELVKTFRHFLVEAITPWLNGSFPGNAIRYDPVWKGLISKNSATDSGADFGLGVYNDHHFHWGYFCYAAAVLAKLDPSWGRHYKHHIYGMLDDFMNVRHDNQFYPRLRSFDMWLMHSWASGLTEFSDGRNQESTSEAVNAYYAASLVGLAYGDPHLIKTGLTLTAFEIYASKALWHIPSNSKLYDPIFVKDNRVVGVLWANKRDSGLWFAPASWLECRLGIQVLPITPITEYLFDDFNFVKELVQWTMPALAREGVGEGWKGFVYAMQSTYDSHTGLASIRKLKGYDDGNSLSNLLWWAHTR